MRAYLLDECPCPWLVFPPILLRKFIIKFWIVDCFLARHLAGLLSRLLPSLRGCVDWCDCFGGILGAIDLRRTIRRRDIGMCMNFLYFRRSRTRYFARRRGVVVCERCESM